jgi:hypothetical protein
MNEGIATRVGSDSGIANDAGNLTPNPFPSGKGNRINRQLRPQNSRPRAEAQARAQDTETAYGMMPRWTKTLPLGPMRTQLMSVRLNSGVQSG